MIDEYDAPIHAAYLNGYLPEAIDFIRTFLSHGLKENRHLWKGVLTGILRVARESIFSGLNNLDVYTLLAEQFRTAFGFTEPEVVDLLARADCSGDLETLRRWYNGYVFGGGVIYNPWSVNQFVSRRGAPAPYWLNTSSNEMVRDLVVRHAPSVEAEIAALLNGESIERELDEALVPPELARGQDALWSLLVFSGYLRAEYVPPVPPLETGTYRLSIPNREIRAVCLRTFVDPLREALERRGQLLPAARRGLGANGRGRLDSGGGPPPERGLGGAIWGRRTAGAGRAEDAGGGNA